MGELDVLIVEDRESDFIFLQNSLNAIENWTINVLSAESFSEAKKIMASENIDIILLDYYIENSKADNFILDIQHFREYVPVVLVNGRQNDTIKMSNFHLSVDDYIHMDDITTPLLSRILKYCVTNNRERLIAKTQKEKYNNLFHNSIEAIFTADENYNVLNANASFKKMVQNDLSSKLDFRELFIDDDYDNHFTALSVASEKEIKRTKLKRSDGKVLQVYLTISRILSETDLASFQVVIHDITELEELQNKMHESDKTKLIQRMARIIGHEVRNPLTNILLATEEMKHDYADNEDTIMMLDMIHRNSKRISALIDNFLNNTRTSEIKKEKVILEQILNNSFNHCKDRIVLKNIDFDFKQKNTKTEMYLDAEKIQIVFTNIIINATEALEGIDNPKLTINIINNPTSVNVKISDNGVGMTEEVQQNLFSPFYSNKQGGLGLGMANSKNMLMAHNAQINFNSQVGTGTTFNIEFPLT